MEKTKKEQQAQQETRWFATISEGNDVENQ